MSGHSEKCCPQQEEYPLDWVDAFIIDIKPHIFLRKQDNLLIILPNQSYKLNKTGVAILEPLLAGCQLEELYKSRTPAAKVKKDLFHFFAGIAAMIKGCLGEGRGRPEVEQVAYERPYHLFPILSEMALTYRCNLKCTFCYAGCNREDSPPDLTVDQIRKIFHKIRHEAHVPSVSFTGGEPTLRKDLPELVREAVATGLRVNLISNGTLITDQLAKDLKVAGLSSAQISIEGPSTELHDELTAAPGSFEKAVQGLKFLKEAGLSVHHNTTLTTRNIDAAPLMADLAQSLGVERFSMNMIIPSPWIKENKPELLIPYTEIGNTVLKVREYSRLKNIRFMWYSPTPYCIFNPIAHNLGNKGCAACDGLLSIDPEGRIIPCSSFFEPQGSLLDEPFEKVWNTKSAVAIRGKSCAPEICRDCKHFELCEGACPLYWSVMGSQELDCAKAKPCEDQGLSLERADWAKNNNFIQAGEKCYRKNQTTESSLIVRLI